MVKPAEMLDIAVELSDTRSLVMPGIVPGIHVFRYNKRRGRP